MVMLPRVPTLLAASIAWIACGAEELPVPPLPSDAARERAAFVSWLESSPTSPLRAVSRLPLNDSLVVGPADSDLPLEGPVERNVVRLDGGIWLEADSGRKIMAPYVPVRLGRYRLVIQGEREAPVLMAFDAGESTKQAPAFFPQDSSLAFEVTVESTKRSTSRMLALDGIEVDGTLVGHVTVALGGGSGTRLEVRHVPDPGTEEASLEIYFRDSTNSDGSYPSGRFVSLIPLGADRYLLDFNRARSPFCAYSTVYPCPVPWRGNMIEARVEAGEMYQDGADL